MNSVMFDDLFLVPLRNGVSYSSAMRGRGVPMVNMGEAFRFDRITDQECERVPLTDKERGHFLLEEGDLLFVRQSLKFEGAGKCIYIGAGKEARTWESHLIRVRLDPHKADSRYYYYYFRSPGGRASIESIIEQVAAAGIRGSDLRRLRVPNPQRVDQSKVANILSTIDGKIAVNDRIASTYEELLKSHFAELQIDVDTAPSSEVAASELVEFNPTLKAPRSSRAVYLDMAAIPTDRAMVSHWSRRDPKPGTRFTNGDTVMARITPCLENGKTAFIDFMEDGEVGIGSTEFIVMRARSGTPVHVPYFLARSPRFRNNAVQNMVGSSGRQRVGAAQLADFALARPDSEQLSAFGATASAAFGHMRNLTDESRNLADLRDALLPGLISGAIRMRDAEKIVEDVT